MQEKSLGSTGLRKVIEGIVGMFENILVCSLLKVLRYSAPWDDKWDNTIHMACETWKKEDCIFGFFKTELHQIYSTPVGLKRLGYIKDD